MPKRVFLAGASGVIGRRLLRQLVASGYSVVGITRSIDKMELIARLGGEPIVLNALDGSAISRAISQYKPDAIVNQLTDLSGMVTAPPDKVIRSNANLRKGATRNLVEAALAANVPLLISQRIAWMYAPGRLPHAETAELDVCAPGLRGISADGIATLEGLTLNTHHLDGVVLRYGHFYGPDTWSEHLADQPAVHIDAAARTVDFALNHVLESVPSAVSTILTLRIPLPSNACSRTTRSISCCEVTPTCFRNLRNDILNRSFSMRRPLKLADLVAHALRLHRKPHECRTIRVLLWSGCVFRNLLTPPR